MSEHLREDEAMKRATEIVIAYLASGKISAEELPALVQRVRAALLEALPANPANVTHGHKPSVAINESVTPEYLVCLEDGERFKSLKRHLKARHNMTPEVYREKWGLPDDYPMVAPAYSEVRSHLALTTGFNAGDKGRSPKRKAAGIRQRR